MSSRRPPSPPPELPGFTYEALLGSGGFADVFLYQQHLPERRVAVKVLLADRMRASTDAFTAEANIMAQLSTHPAIVTIHQAGVAADGRPYLVMEYCPKPNLQVRYRREPFSVAESLRIGVQVAAAVETAHRAGILHRDIKPANILVTEYNRPALTDFGIASTTDADVESAGMSIPWSPPEAFADESSPGVTADVWALGATVYTLLAGRSPFELPGERNSSADLIQRIETLPLPALGRADAPATLQDVLARAMAKNPAARYASAIDFARALQRVQIALSMAPTPIDVLDDALPADAEEDDDDGLTRIRSVVNIDPTGAAPAAPSAPPPVLAPAEDEATRLRDVTVVRGVTDTSGRDTTAAVTGSRTARRDGIGDTAVRTEEATVRRPHTVGAPEPEPDPHAPAEHPRGRGGLIAAIVAGVVVVGAVGVAWAASAGLLAPSPEPSPSSTSVPVDPLGGGGVGFVEDLAGTAQGDQVVFTWTNPDPQDGDSFNWAILRLGEDPRPQNTAETTVTVPAEPGGRTCIAVYLVRGGQSTDQPAEGCVP